MTENQSSTPRRIFPAWLAGPRGAVAFVTTLYTLVYLVWLYFRWGGEENVTLIGDLLYLPMNLAIVIAAWVVSRQKDLAPRMRRMWLLLGFGFLSYFLGSLAWTYLENVLEVPPFPSIADLFYLLFAPLAVAGIFSMPTTPLIQRERRQYAFDMLIVMTTTVMLMWHYIIQPTAVSYTGDAFVQAIAVAYPVTDVLIIIGIVGALLRHPDRDTKPVLWLLFLGMSLFVAADIVFGYTSLLGTYGPGSLADYGWAIAFQFFLFAALRQMYRMPSEAPGSRLMIALDRLAHFIPNLAVVLGGLLAINAAVINFSPGSVWLLAGAVLIFILVIARQFGQPRSQERLNVAFKMIGIAALVFGLIAAVQIRVSSVRFQNQLEEEARARLNGYYQAYEGHIEAESNAVGALAASIADRPDVQELYLKGDREGLYNLLAPMFEDMKARQVVHLYIERPNGTVFLRVHNPEKFGDDVTYRGTAAEALSTRKITSGVEMGPNRLGVRGVAPMYSGAQFIGMVEMGLDFDQQFVDDLKELTGADFTMWVTYEAAAVPNLKPVEGVPAAPIEELFYYVSTNPQHQPVDPQLYRSTLASGTPSFQAITENSPTPSIVYITPLLGYKGKPFGLLEISISYVDTLAAFEASRVTSISVVGALTLGGLILIMLATSQFVLRPLNALTEFANRQLSGDLGARVSVHSGDEFERLANTFNSLSDAVEQERRMLEQRVSDRTRALATSAEVSRRLSTILDQKQLVAEVVEQVKSAFDYYHVHIYLTDDSSGNLIMMGGTGDAGAAMLAQGHKLPRGRGLVGRAAETRETVLVSDVSKEPGWLSNPLLPNTKSEVALPIVFGGNVLGVLDVQQNAVDGFSERDLSLLQSIAGQVAVSLQNARSYEQARAQADLETQVNVISQKIQRAASVEDVLQTAIREVGLALGAARVTASVQVSQPVIDHAAGGNNGNKPDQA